MKLGIGRVPVEGGLGGLGAAFDNADIGDPVALAACKARLDALTLEVGGRWSEPRMLDVFQHTDVDYRIEIAEDVESEGGGRFAA